MPQPGTSGLLSSSKLTPKGPGEAPERVSAAQGPRLGEEEEEEGWGGGSASRLSGMLCFLSWRRHSEAAKLRHCVTHTHTQHDTTQHEPKNLGGAKPFT